MSKIVEEYRKFMETSRWIKSVGSNGWNEWDNLKCPDCGVMIEEIKHPQQYRFCPNCGADMMQNGG